MTLRDRSRTQRSREGNAERHLIALFGPAFVAAIAYVDPGNVAANISAGAGYRYRLVWVLVLANAMAIIVQYMAAKLGLVTGRSLPQLLGERMGRSARLAYWAQAELVAAATDLAEIVGGALALRILFQVPLLVGGLIVGVVSMALLALQSRKSQRTFEFVVVGLLAIIAVGFVAGVAVSSPDWDATATGLAPRFDGSETVLLTCSMLGATVMPHAIYLHSSLAIDRHGITRDPGRIRMLLRANRWDVTLALLVAGGVNIAILLLAASALPGTPGADTIDGAHHAIVATLGPLIGVAFGIGLLVSSLASTSVGCYAGSEIMSGLLRRHIPVRLRRAVTLIPALIILSVGINPTWALVISQVFLSIGIPFALIPLAHLTRNPSLMGTFANRLPLRITAGAVVAAIITLNVVMLYLTFTGHG